MALLVSFPTACGKENSSPRGQARRTTATGRVHQIHTFHPLRPHRYDNVPFRNLIRIEMEEETTVIMAMIRRDWVNNAPVLGKVKSMDITTIKDPLRHQPLCRRPPQSP